MSLDQMTSVHFLSAFLGLAQIAPADDIAAKPYKILAPRRFPPLGGLTTSRRTASTAGFMSPAGMR
jgi:hypothetical protein